MMKRKCGGWILAVCLLSLCGCADGSESMELADIQPETYLETAESNLDGWGRFPAEVTSEGGDQPAAQAAVSGVKASAPGGEADKAHPAASDVKASVRCAEMFYKLNFAAGGQNVYVCGSREEPPAGGSLADITYFVGVTDAPEAETGVCALRELAVDMPEDMRVLRMAADTEGNCHLLWVSKGVKTVDGQEMEPYTYEKIRIMAIGADGSVKKNMDVSGILAENHGLMYCFTVDGDGNYYLELGSEIIKISADGRELPRIRCDGRVESIGCGRSGAVYCVCRGDDRAEWLCRIEGDSARALAKLPQAETLYPCMGAGTDTELILFHRDGGIYAADIAAGKDETADIPADNGESAAGLKTDSEVIFSAELRVQESKMPVSGQDIGGEGVLADGRVCLFAQGGKEAVFYYIPVGR